MQLIVRGIERDAEQIADLEAKVSAFLEETDARLQALLTAYDPERTFAQAAEIAMPGRAHAPGSINVTDLGRYPDNTWFGRVYRDGRFEPSPRVEMPADLVALLKRFAKEPAKVASEFGRATGRCCFCNTELTDPRSTAAGFGPVCAAKWSLKDHWKAADSVFATAA